MVSHFFYNFVYFNKFNDKLRPATDAEKQKIIEILKEKKGFEESQIKIGNIFPSKKGDLAQVLVIINGSKEPYLIDITRGEILKK